jgi:TolB-like protein/Tfp pilus assembly protein PilF
MGDGLLIEFESTVDAVGCAVEWQQRVGEYSRTIPVVFRIGINLGDIVVDGDDILGDGVNIAARLEGLAPPGGLCIADAVYEQVRDRLDVRFNEAGERRLKNVDRPVKVWTWHPGIGPRHPDRRLADGRKELLTLAVLPFKNFSADPQQAYFAEGIGEDVITGLSRNSALRVVSRIVGPAAPKAGEVAVADFLLEGSVRRSQGRTRVAARLTDAVSGDQIWAEQFDSDIDDLFALQDEIAASIVHALAAADGVIEKSAQQRRTERSSAAGSAYDWYLHGRHLFYKHGDVGIDRAEACYRRALALDADFAPACSALAWLHVVRFKLFGTQSFAAIRSQAVQLALRALELDREDFRAHWVLGAVYLHDGEHALSLAEFDKALRINPNDASLLAWSSEALIYAGFLDEAIRRCDRAMRINPNGPDWYHWIKAFALFHQGRYELALAELNRMSTPSYAGKLKAAVLAYLGRLDKASAERDAFMAMVPTFRAAKWALTEKYAEPAELERYVEGLRKAGFPD